MDWHLLWLWTWFTLGCGTYWLKRAYYLVTGPNPVATTYTEFVKKCWIPILVRWFIDAMFYWVMLIPGGPTSKILAYYGWDSYQWAILAISQFAPISALFGHAIDSIVDFAVSKIPWIKDVLPQIPPPLKELPSNP